MVIPCLFYFSRFLLETGFFSVYPVCFILPATGNRENRSRRLILKMILLYGVNQGKYWESEEIVPKVLGDGLIHYPTSWVRI